MAEPSGAGADLEPAAPGIAEPDFDLDAVVREIDAEVRALRRSGEIPSDLERRLDELFARHAPAAVSDDFDTVLDQAERDVGLSYAVPTASRLPGGSFVKRLVVRTIGWYVTWFVRELSGLSATLVRAVRLLARRVASLEAATGVGDARLAAAVGPPAAIHAAWSARVAGLLAGSGGRIVVADAGAGDHLQALVAAGLDAYGAAPRLDAVDALADAGLDVRHAGVLEHLRRLRDASLGGVVLVGCVESLPRGELVELAEQAVRVVAPGGRIVVVSSSPEGHARAVGVVAADLAAGRPLHAATWQHLLRSAGCEAVDVHAGEDAVALAATGTPEVDANFARLADALLPPASYAVVARRA